MPDRSFTKKRNYIQFLLLSFWLGGPDCPPLRKMTWIYMRRLLVNIENDFKSLDWFDRKIIFLKYLFKFYLKNHVLSSRIIGPLTRRTSFHSGFLRLVSYDFKKRNWRVASFFLSVTKSFHEMKIGFTSWK